MSRETTHSQDGFTLVEVLAALVVFSIISVISAGMLSTALRAEDGHDRAMAEVGQVEALRATLREDMGQLVARPFRGEDGEMDPRVFAGGLEGGRFSREGEMREVLVFTRRGQPNPGAVEARSSLMRVAYRYDGETLERAAWTFPDAARGLEPSVRVLLEDAEGLEMDFLFGQWTNQALPADQGGTLPRAVRLAYDAERAGRMEHVALTPLAEGAR